MKADDLRQRTKNYALRIIRLYRKLPRSKESEVVGVQLLRSGTSVGAQFREGYRAKSKADFISKITGSVQELDESLYWLELLGEAEIVPIERLEPLMQETNELIAILTTILKGQRDYK